MAQLAISDNLPTAGRRAPLTSLIVAEAISMLGNRMMLVAVPWLVLVATGSPAKMGIVGGVAALALVLSSVFGAPLVDRFGMRRVSIATDVGSAVALGLIGSGLYDGYGTLVAVMAFSSAMSGVGIRAKRVLLAPVAAAAGTPMRRVTAIYEGLSRTATLVGASVGGVLIAWLGPLRVILLDSCALLLCATIVAIFVQVSASDDEEPSFGPGREPYFQALRGGFQHVRQDRLMTGMMTMLVVTNTVNQAASSVLLPLWARAVIGSPIALGLLGAAFACGAILGNIVFAVLATRLPRYFTLTIGYLIGGAPRFIALLVSHDLAVVLAVMFISGVAISTVNPTYGALLYERVPASLRARVFGLSAAITTAGMPLGGLLGGLAVARFGLNGGLALAAVLYFSATMIPIRSRRLWREIDGPTAEHAPTAGPSPVRVFLVDRYRRMIQAVRRAGRAARVIAVVRAQAIRSTAFWPGAGSTTPARAATRPPKRRRASQPHPATRRRHSAHRRHHGRRRTARRWPSRRSAGRE